ncbi:MAG: beta-galactosidase [Candidatus Acidiferrales bacterium]
MIDASVAAAPPAPLWFAAGGRSPQGETLGVNSRYLLRDGKPWFPVMGEFQFSRYPASEWEDEILKMKAGGIQVISTYVFWIHVEEIEGQFDWTGQRDLRRFVELCRKHGMYVWVRIGPWDHGECRNGGFPDWLINKGCPVRQIDPVYLGYVSQLYNQIGGQLRGLLWRDGGPVIGIQLENEYHERGPGKGVDYLVALRKLALQAGLNAPFFTITGWDDAVIPPDGVLPVFGGYEDGFWWRSVDELPPSANYFFTPIRRDEDVGDDLKSKRPDIDALDSRYPFLTAEMGGGMELSYHRRPLIAADDIAAMVVTRLGSGVSLYGYYMFQGGTNPEGKLTTLEESQATGYPNDMPVKSYDFQAPLGEFGQMHDSFRVLKIFDMFLGDFGSSLAPMTPYFPERMPANKNDTGTPRVAVRMQGNRGFLFINNYQRTYPLPERTGFQVKIETRSGGVEIPRAPVNIPSGAYAIWPVNLDLGSAVLRYATAQPLCRLREQNTFVFFASPGIAPEFAIEDANGNSIEAPHATILRSQDATYVSGIEPGPQIAITIRDRKGGATRIIVLSREQSLDAWKATLGGRERLILSPADIFFDGDRIHLRASDPALLEASFYPAWMHSPTGFQDIGRDGIFERYTVSPQPAPLNLAASVQESDSGGDPPPAKMGHGVAIVPDDSEFDTAARWTIRIPGAQTSNDSLLSIQYQGDIARLYVDGKLFTDNFYNGSAWEIGLWRFSPQELAQGLELRVLALRSDTPMYLPPGARPTFPASGQIAKLIGVRVIPEYEVVRDLGHDQH